MGDHVKISNVMLNLRRLALEDFDTLLQSIDISKLVVSDVNNTVNQPKQVPDIVEEVRDIIIHVKIIILQYIKTRYRY